MTPRWGIPVPLLPGEVLSSWLVRTALVFGCDPLVLTGDLWPKWRIWTRDPDRGLPPEKMEILVQASGIGESRLAAASLRPVAETISGAALEERRGWPWMLALGSRNRKRRGGLQYCPLCLAEDKHPYYRLHWRLAWHTGCVRHRCLLRDLCPHCAAPIEPHRLSAEDDDMAKCATCKESLAAAPATDADANPLAFQDAADKAIARRTARYGEWEIPADEWFLLARHMVLILRKAGADHKSRPASLVREMGIEPESLRLPKTGLFLEVLPAGERAALLGDAWRMLSAGPERLLASAMETGMTAEGLQLDTRRPIPESIERICWNLPEAAKRPRRPRRGCRPTGPRSRASVERMWARLQRKARGMGG